MSVVSMNYLLEAGVQFGHQKRRWNPKMKEYIYTTRDDIYIIDLQKTVKKLEEAYEAMKESELYNSIWKKIEDYATNLVNTKCVPEWNRISEEMKPLWEERNKLAKEKAEVPEDWVWETEKEERLAEVDKKIAELTEEYQSVTDKANAELNEYKEKILGETEWACFFLSEKDYQFVGELCWFYSAN